MVTRSWSSRSNRYLFLLIGILLSIAFSSPANSGTYLASAHGDPINGVNSTTLDLKYGDYAIGNCGHCHQMHASIDGAQPEPANGPAPHALFFNFFNPLRTQNLYFETDNFCFYCHGDTGQQVLNQDYSTTFGGAVSGSGPQSILSAFNLQSYHNLYDVWNFVSNTPAYAWFGSAGNPCSACHNPHLAKRTWSSIQPGFPLLSAISKPDGHNALWGENELMQSYLSYEAPYFKTSDLTREPAGVGDANGSNTPDYVSFCSSCHNTTNVIWSTTLNRELKKIDWGVVGLEQDKHGPSPRGSVSHFRDPYLSSEAGKSNFVLSCLDCHESHGSENIMLLRRRINGENLEGVVDALNTVTKGYVCKRCHQDDFAAIGGTADSWEYVHHNAPGAPYAQTQCTDCHVSELDTHIDCGNCHAHGLDDSWLGANATGLKTF